MAKLAKKSGKDAGNVTVVDLGEEVDKVLVKRIDQKLKAAGVVGKEQMAGPGFSGYRAGGYRPGMFGHRPWYADKQNKFGAMMGASYSERWRGLAHPHLGKMAIGGAIGVVVDMALMRVTPEVVKSDLQIVHSALAFVVGLVPVLAKPNSYTLGVAVPGAVLLGSSLINAALDWIGVKKPALRGTESGARQSIESAVSARAKLQQVHGAMNRTQAPARVTAQAVA